MAVDLYFGVPLIVRDVEPAVRDAIRAKVLAYLDSARAKQDVAPAPEESVSTSYYKPEESILADADLRELETVVVDAARAFLEHTLKLPPRRLAIERAWINVFEPGAQEAQHSHDGNLLSCSYYVDAPENCGCIVFPDPIGERRSYREFTQTVGPDLLTRREIAVEVQPGRLVMFESWLPHAVQCNKSDKVRISIALNLRYAAEEAAPATGWASPVGKPFLFNELFDVHTNLTVSLNAIEDAIPTVVIDNFLKHPVRVREIVGSTSAANWKHAEGGRNFVDYYDCRIRFPIWYPNNMIALVQQAIGKVYAVATRPADARVDVNWFRQIHEKRGDFAVPHSDAREDGRRSFTCIVYLNQRDECSGGTAFFRFKASSSLVLDEAYTRAIRQDSRIAETGRDYWPYEADEHWQRVGAVDMVPGRLLIFPSEYYHAAYHPLNSFFEFPRLTLAFWMIC